MDLCRLCLTNEKLITDLSESLYKERPEQSIKDVLETVFKVQVGFKGLLLDDVKTKQVIFLF